MTETASSPSADSAEPSVVPASLPKRGAGFTRRALRVLCFAVLSLSIVLFALLWWFINTNAGLRATVAAGEWLLPRLAGMSLQVKGIDGCLADQFSIAELSWSQDMPQGKAVIAVNDVHWQWREDRASWLRVLRSAWQRDFAVQLFSVRELNVAWPPAPAEPPDTAPLLPPSDLKVPLRWSIQQLAAEKIIFNQTVYVENLSAALSSDGQAHRLERLAFRHNALQLSSEAQLQALPPFDLAATFSVQGTLPNAWTADLPEQVAKKAAQRVSLQLSLSGQLAAIDADFHAQGAVQGQGKVRLNPFAAMPLRSLDLQLAGVNPKEWWATAPAANLTLDAALHTAKADTQSASGNAKGADVLSLAGHLRLSNRAPKRIDLGGVPLEKLSADWQWKNQRLKVSQLVADFADGGGAIKANGHYQADGSDLAATVDIHDLAVQKLWQQADLPLSSATVGKVTVRGSLAKQVVDLALRDAVLLPQPLSLNTQLQHDGKTVDLSPLSLTVGDSKISAQSKIVVSDQQTFSLKGSIRELKAVHWTKQPYWRDAEIDAQFDAEGKLSGDRLAVDLQVEKGRLRGQDVHGFVRANVQGKRITDLNVDLRAGANRLQGEGQLDAVAVTDRSPGGADNKIHLRLDFPDLSPFAIPDRVDGTIKGDLKAELDLRGRLDAPHITAHLMSKKLFLPTGLAMDGLDAQIQVGGGLDDPLRLLVKLARLDTPTREKFLREVSLDLSGSNREHRLQASLRLPRRQTLAVRLSGGLNSALQWQKREQLAWKGRLEEAVFMHPLEGGYRFSQQGDTQVSAQAWRLENVQIATQKPPASAANNGVKNGMQNTALGNVQRTPGAAEASTENGAADILMAPFAATFSAQAQQKTRQLNADFQLTGEAYGRIDAHLQAPLAGDPWHLALNSPWRGELDAAIESLAWAGKFIGKTWSTGGSLNAQVRLQGTAKRPQVNGQISGKKLLLADSESGLQLENGTLNVRLDNEVLLLDQLEWFSRLTAMPRELVNSRSEEEAQFAKLLAKPGRLSAQGRLSFAGAFGDEGDHSAATLQVNLDRLGVSQQEDQWLLLSGQSTVSFQDNSLLVNGDLVIDAGLWKIRDLGSPSLSADVVVRHTGETDATSRWHPDITLKIDFGKNFLFSGYGLNTRLAGAMAVYAKGRDLPRAEGRIRTQAGRFEAYGQKLSIRRGVVMFDGLVNNPSLDIQALRTGLAVEAGVKVSGTVLQPQIQLISEPDVPDTEKLTWLVLGHGPENMSIGDSALLMTAADGLLGNESGSVVQQMRDTVGIDEFSVRQGELGQSGNHRLMSRVVGGAQNSNNSAADQILSIGKRFTANTKVTYEQSLGQASSLLRFTHDWSRNLTFSTSVGSDSVLEVFYNWVFGIAPQSNQQPSATQNSGAAKPDKATSNTGNKAVP